MVSHGKVHEACLSVLSPFFHTVYFGLVIAYKNKTKNKTYNVKTDELVKSPSDGFVKRPQARRANP